MIVVDKPENITLGEDLLGNSIYRKSIKQGLTHEKARNKGFQGILYHRITPNKSLKEVINEVTN